MPRRRRRWSWEEKLRILADFDRSGQSLARFAKEVKIDSKLIGGWKRQRDAEEESRVLPVALKDGEPSTLDLVVSDFTIRVPTDFDELSLLRLIEVLRGC